MSALTGPNASFIKIISCDNHEFLIKREVALTSGTIKAMLSGPGTFQENETNEIHFQEIPSHVLSKGKILIIFLDDLLIIFNLQFVNTSHTKPVTRIPPWKFPSFQLPLKSPWSCLWLQIFLIAEN